MKPIVQILLTVALLLSANPVLASAPFKIGEYKDACGLNHEIYKQANPAGENKYYIEIGSSLAKDNKTFLVNFLAVENKDVELLFEDLRKFKGLLDTYGEKEWQNIDYDYRGLAYAKLLQTYEANLFSNINTAPTFELRDYERSLYCGSTNGIKRITLFLTPKKKKSPGPGVMWDNINSSSIESLIKTIETDKSTANDGMLNAENIENLGKWATGCNVYRYRTKGGNTRYYIQTVNFSVFISGQPSNYLWFKDSELSSFIGFLKALNSKWENCSANSTYHGNTESNSNTILFDIPFYSEIQGFIGNIYQDVQIMKLLNFSGNIQTNYTEYKNGLKFLAFYLYWNDEDGKSEAYNIQTNGDELKSLISILEKAKQTN